MTDPARTDDAVLAVVRACGAALGGKFGVVLREAHRGEPFERALKETVIQTGAFLSVKRDPMLAEKLGAKAVHLGGAPFDASSVQAARARGLHVSAAAHSADELREARALGIPALVLSPVFTVAGKGPARGLSCLREARALAPDTVVFALGGVSEANANDCYDAGAYGIAVQRALFDAERPAEAARSLLPRT